MLEAERSFGPLGIRIVPVGLLFDSKGRFRSRALVQVGEPLDLAPEADLYRSAQTTEEDEEPGAEAVRTLTARIDDALRSVTVNYTSWDEARLIARAADLFARPELDAPGRRSLEEGFALRRAFLQGARDLQKSDPDRLAALAEEVRAYDRLLRAFDLRDDQVAARYLPQPVLRFVVTSLLRLLVHLPLAAVGTALNLLPYGVVRLIATKAEDQPDQQATLKVFPSLVAYPLLWLLEAGAIGWSWGAEWGVLAFLIALPSGYAALLFHERRRIFWREARAFLLLRTRGRAGGAAEAAGGAVPGGGGGGGGVRREAGIELGHFPGVPDRSAATAILAADDFFQLFRQRRVSAALPGLLQSPQQLPGVFLDRLVPGEAGKGSAVPAVLEETRLPRLRSQPRRLGPDAEFEDQWFKAFPQLAVGILNGLGGQLGQVLGREALPQGRVVLVEFYVEIVLKEKTGDVLRCALGQFDVPALQRRLEIDHLDTHTERQGICLFPSARHVLRDQISGTYVRRQVVARSGDRHRRCRERRPVSDPSSEDQYGSGRLGQPATD